MNFKILLLFLSIFIVGNIYSITNNNSQTRVLVIFSYEEKFPTYYDVNRAIREYSDSLDYDFETFYLDSKYRTDTNYFKAITQLLNEKFSKRDSYQAILTVDDNALQFTLLEKEHLFNNIPIIFMGVNDVEYGLSMSQQPNITGVIETVNMVETLELMQQLQPDLDSVYIITDQTKTAQLDLSHFKEAISTKPSLQYSILNVGSLSFSEFYKKIEVLQQNKNAILLLAAYRDKNDKYMNFRQISNNLLAKSNLPIYHIYKHGVGSGFIGGILVCHYQQAKIALNLLTQVLEGRQTKKPKIIDKSPYIGIVDLATLKKFNIIEENIPAGITIINPERNTITVNRTYFQWLIWACIVLLGVILSIVAIINFLTVKNRKLKKDNELYSKLFRESPIPMFIIDPITLKISDVNIAASKLYGYSFEEFKLLKINDLNKLPDKDVFSLINNILNKDTLEVNLKHYKKCGDELTVEIYTGSIVFKNRRMIYTVIFDQSRQKQMETELRLALDQARENEMLKLSFLRSMNHEVRTPLNGVVGFTELLLHKIEENESTIKYGGYIRSCSEKLMEIIDSVLDISLIENKQTKAYSNKFNTLDLIEEACNKYAAEFKAKSLKFVKHIINIEKDDEMYSDRSKILKIINHLLNNALKFTTTGSIELVAKNDQNNLQISIKDTGIGIDSQFQHIIFDRFRQVELSDTPKYGGTGIGLAIVKEYVSMLSGKISVESELGKGSCFTFQIPLEIKISNSSNTSSILSVSIN